MGRDGKVEVEEVDLMATWKAMEELVDEGLVRHIGKSCENAHTLFSFSY